MSLCQNVLAHKHVKYARVVCLYNLSRGLSVFIVCGNNREVKISEVTANVALLHLISTNGYLISSSETINYGDVVNTLQVAGE